MYSIINSLLNHIVILVKIYNLKCFWDNMYYSMESIQFQINSNILLCKVYCHFWLLCDHVWSHVIIIFRPFFDVELLLKVFVWMVSYFFFCTKVVKNSKFNHRKKNLLNKSKRKRYFNVHIHICICITCQLKLNCKLKIADWLLQKNKYYYYEYQNKPTTIIVLRLY